MFSRIMVGVLFEKKKKNSIQNLFREIMYDFEKHKCVCFLFQDYSYIFQDKSYFPIYQRNL